MIDRNIAPDSHLINRVNFIEPELFSLENGIKVFGINSGSQEVVKIDFIFDAGSWYQPYNLVAGLSNAFIAQGSKNYTAQQIAEVFDSCGAYIQPSADQHLGIVNILTLNRHLPKILELTSDIIKNATYPEMEINAQINKRRQQFVIENNKVKVLSQKAFSKALFGENHPYANTNTIDDFERLTPALLKKFHQQHYCSNSCKIVVSGKYYDSTLQHLLNQFFGGNDWAYNELKNTNEYSIAPLDTERKIKIDKADALQSAVRIGCLFPNRNHNDYFGLSILTAVFGGYFGSRLMTNIREEKGFTYGIGANVITFPHAAYFTIFSEVGKAVCQPAIDEVYAEMLRLQNELIPAEELETVRNYLLGELLRSFDGVFAMAASFRVLLDSGLDYSHYEGYLKVLQTITAEELQALARQYYNPMQMVEVIAG